MLILNSPHINSYVEVAGMSSTSIIFVFFSAAALIGIPIALWLGKVETHGFRRRRD